MEKDFASLVGTSANKIVNSTARELTPTYAQDSPSDPYKPNLAGRRSWAASDDVYTAIGESHATLPVGLYSCEVSQFGPYLRKMTNNIDALIDLPDSESERLLEEIIHFRELKSTFNEFGFLYKRGILLWGPPGSGKTVTIQQLLKLFVTDGDGIAVMIQQPDCATACLNMVRTIEPERQILAIMEDIDALIDRFGESGYLNLLDGESQLQNVVYVATTNYPERLDKRFVDRPSRFDTIRYIGMPTAAARRAYLVAKMPKIDEMTVTRYVKETDGFSIAYLRELVVLTQCFGFGLDASIERLRKMHKNQPKSGTGEGSTFGFA
ncbi:ATP-binding protein [Herbaspirillum sp. ST 5-3]|uniref:AAA family ATPase n=1 Tax=Oxalobacteraceae TaxID=75682 RepID=UPI0010A2D268|nr:ATP-binding protein [Herbaspirillum sp. ST 5-3]